MVFTLEGRRSRGGFQLSNIAHLVYRFIQIIMACVVIGFYASDLNAARKVHKYADSKWVRIHFFLSAVLKNPHTNRSAGVRSGGRFDVSYHSSGLWHHQYLRTVPSDRHAFRVGMDTGHPVGSCIWPFR